MGYRSPSGPGGHRKSGDLHHRKSHGTKAAASIRRRKFSAGRIWYRLRNGIPCTDVPCCDSFRPGRTVDSGNRAVQCCRQYHKNSASDKEKSAIGTDLRLHMWDYSIFHSRPIMFEAISGIKCRSVSKVVRNAGSNALL